MKSDGADQAYWDALAEGRLELPRCRSCGRWRWPAVWRCGDCGAWEPAWIEVAPRGEIYSWTRTWHPFGGTEALNLPFVSLVVSLPAAGGVRLTGLLDGDETGLAIGAAVAGAPSEVAVAGRTVPALRWRLIPGAAS
jgi:uncharacterized OB-fold protein